MATSPQPTACTATSRPRRDRYTDADLAQIRQWTLAGISGKEIASRLNRPRSIISKIQRHRLGLDPRALRLLAPPPPPKPKPEPPKPLQTSGTWRVSRANAKSLIEWQKTTSHTDTLDRFIDQIVEVALAEYRQRSRANENETGLPLSGQNETIEVTSNDYRRTKLSAETIQRVQRLLADGEKVPTIAAGCGLSETTIHRIKAKRGER